MIDFHSHVLPGIDDGSDCVEESLEMLHTAKNQGVSTMLATPHFYAQDVSVDHFLEKRKKAYDTLKRCMDDSDCPDIRLGAEVCYFRGIGRAREIEKLCIEGTRVIMVELPFRQWDEEVLRDVEELMEKQNVSVMLAHIERFYACQKRKKIWKEVLDLPVIFQVNAEFFDGRKKRKLIKKLVEDGIVDGWDDPRLVSIAALRRRGFTPESIKMFVDLCGISKSQSSVDYAMLEYCIREDLKAKKPRLMAVLDPIKVIIDNYPEDQVEWFDVVNNVECPELGTRKVPFCKEIYIDREDFMEEPPKKYFRLFPGNEVRLMNAYFVKCVDYKKDENGNVTEIHCTYDPETRSGSGFTGRKVKGTIHWVSARHGVKSEVRLYENIVDEEKGKLNEDGTLNLNPNSLTVLKDCYVEPNIADVKPEDKFQFVRQGYFCADLKDYTKEKPVFNRIVSLKSSFKLPK